MTSLSELGQAALRYAALGLYVFPCAPGEKRPAGGLVASGQLEATTNENKVRDWWAQEPSANVAIFLKPSGLVCVDADLYKPECEWEEMVAGQAIPPTWYQDTPSGGRHYIFNAEAGVMYGGNTYKGIDIKWDGYVLVAPSVVGGIPYVGDARYLAPAPSWVPRRNSHQAQDNFTANGKPFPKIIDRSVNFFKLVCNLRRSGLTLDAAEAALRANPNETGAIKYLEGVDRLRGELERAWYKAVTNPQIARPGFKLRLASEFDCSEPDWLIDGLVEVGALVMLFGEPGIGKSFLAIDWAYSVATGSDFLGRPVQQGAVVYIAGEGHRGFGRRREAWELHSGIDTSASPVFLSEGPANMLDAVSEVKAAIAELPFPPALIILDTLARNFGGGDENSTKDASAFIASADNLRSDYPDCVVLIVHHSGHAEKQRARGAMALKGAVDIEYRLEATHSGLRLINTKMKDGETPQSMSMELKSVGQSAVLVAGKDQQSGQVEKISTQQRLALDAYIKGALLVGHLGDETPVSTEVWREEFYKSLGEKAKDTKKKAFMYARRSLVAKGFLVEDGDGYRPDHIRQIAIRAENMLTASGRVNINN